MKRMRVLFGQRRMQLLATAAVLLLAVGVVVGSGANFSTSAASAGNTFTAGYVGLSPNGTLSFGPLATLAALPLALALRQRMNAEPIGRGLNEVLVRTAQFQVLLGVLLVCGLLIGF